MEEILVIVDIQKEFSSGFPYNYLKNVFNLCKTYNKVYQIYDITGTDFPSYKFPNQVDTIKKQFGGELLFEDIEFYKWDKKTKEQLKQYFKFNSFQQGDLFQTINGIIFLYVGGYHPWFIFEDDLLIFFDEIKNKQQMIHFIGGGENECLMDIITLADSIGVSYKTLYEYVYP